MTLIASPDFLSSLSRLPGAWRFFPKQRIVCFRFVDCCLYSLKSETFTISKEREWYPSAVESTQHGKTEQ